MENLADDPAHDGGGRGGGREFMRTFAAPRVLTIVCGRDPISRLCILKGECKNFEIERELENQIVLENKDKGKKKMKKKMRTL